MPNKDHRRSKSIILRSVADIEVAASDSRSSKIKGKGTMREAFPSLPSGSPDLEKQRQSSNHSDTKAIATETIISKDTHSSCGGGSGGGGSSSSGSGSLKKFEPQTTPQLNKGRKTTTKVGHQQSHNTKFSTTIKSDGQAHSDRDGTCVCTTSADNTDGMYLLTLIMNMHLLYFYYHA